MKAFIQQFPVSALVVLSFSSASAQKLPNLYHDERHGDAPYRYETGWRPLLNGKDLSGWHAQENEEKGQWFTSQSVNWSRVFGPKRLIAKPAPGDRIVNVNEGKAPNLVTDEKFGSFELYLEFLIPSGSNSGVYLHGLYEVQIFDSYGFTGSMTVGDCGGIYEQLKVGGGSPPARNAARPAGDWQTLRIWFQGPKLDSQGNMARNPKVLRVVLNDVPIQENVTLSGPTIAHMNIAPAERNPIMLQGTHGPVAFRNIYIKEFE